MKKLFGILAAIFALAVLAVFFLLENPDRFKQQISTSLTQATGYGVNIGGQLAWRYWPPIAIEVEGVTLTAADQSIASFEVLEADVDLMPLLLGQAVLQVNQVTLTGGEITLVVDESGTPNWQISDTRQDTDAPADAGSTRATSVSQVLIESMKLSYQDLGSGNHFEADINRLEINNFASNQPFSLQTELSARDLNKGFTTELTGTGLIALNTQDQRTDFSNLALSGTANIGQGSLPIDLEITGHYNQANSQLNLDNYAFNYNGIELRGDLALNTSQDLRVDSNFSLSGISARSLKETANIEAPINGLELTGELTGSMQAMSLNTLNGKLDDSTFSASASFNPTEQSLIRSDVRIDQINLDRYLANTDETQADQEATPNTEQLIPLELLRQHILNSIIRIDTATYGGDTFSQIKLEIANDKKQFRFTANANTWEGKLVANADTDLIRAMTNLKVTLDNLDVLAMTSVQGLTGKLTATSNLNFAGSTLEDIEQSVRGRSVFTVKDGTFDVRPIKTMVGTIDAIRGKSSGIETWPDMMAFNQLVGEQIIEQGLRKSQLVTADLQNLKLTAIGGINLEASTLNFDLAAQFSKPKDASDIPVSDQLVGVRWPMNCSGQFTDTPASLCFGREGAIQSLMADIMKQELERRGTDKLNDLISDKVPEEYRDLTRELFKGLFKKD